MIRRRDISSSLRLTREQFDATHEALNKARSTTKVIGVDRAALTALLMDYSAMVERLERLEQ